MLCRARQQAAQLGKIQTMRCLASFRGQATTRSSLPQQPILATAHQSFGIAIVLVRMAMSPFGSTSPLDG
jgi:hypothetical protein